MNDLKEKLRKIFDTEDISSSFSNEDIKKNNGVACLAYWGLLLLIPLFVAKNSPYGKFHTNQGLLLFIVDIVLGAVSTFLNEVLGWIPIVGMIISIVTSLLGIAMLIYTIVRTTEAYRGKAKEIPFIGWIKIIK